MSNNDIGKKIKELRTSLGLTLEQVGNAVGVGKSTVRKWETGAIANMGRDKIAKLAAALHISPAYLMGWDEMDMAVAKMYPWYVPGQGTLAEQAMRIPNIEPLPHMQKIPLLGAIACGTPITAEENVEDYISAPDDLSCTFALCCKGDSMAPRVMDGDLVYIRQQPDVEDGQIAAVVIDGEATLKHVYHIPGGVQLVSDNPAYHPMIYTGANSDELRIIGLAVAYQRML